MYVCTYNIPSPLDPSGSSALAGAVALTQLWTLQYSDGKGKMAAILGKVCSVHGNLSCFVCLLLELCACLCVSAGRVVPVKFHCVQQPIWSS